MSDRADIAFRRHRGHVFQYLRRAGSDEVAEDLTQDVFVAASEHLARLDADKPALAWLYRVAQNRLLDELRHSRRHPRPLSLDVVAEPGRLDYGAEVAAALRRASLRLTRDEREVVGLRLFGECSFADVGTRLEISAPAARMRYLRALRALRAELKRGGVRP